jgi:hypothetical protein
MLDVGLLHTSEDPDESKPRVSYSFEIDLIDYRSL